MQENMLLKVARFRAQTVTAEPESVGRFMVWLRRRLEQEAPGSKVTAPMLSRCAVASLDAVAKDFVAMPAVNAGFAYAVTNGWILIQQSCVVVTQKGLNASTEPLEAWAVPSLPEPLARLAGFLQACGGAATAKAIENAPDIGMQPSKLLGKYRARWGAWIDAHIKKEGRGVYRLV